MLRKQISATAVLAFAGTLAAATVAQAEEPMMYGDMPGFGGLYLGLNAGFGGLNASQTVTSAASTFGSTGEEMNAFDSGGIFGAQIGYNYLRGQYLFGLEADFQGTSIDAQSAADEPAPYDRLFTAEWDSFATIRGRLGFVENGVLLYGTAGVAFINQSICADESPSTPCSPNGFGVISFDETDVGYAIGAGAEVMLSSRLSLKGEWLFVDAGSTTKTVFASLPDQLSFDSSAHMFRIGLNYLTGHGALGDSGAPVAERPIYSFDGLYAGLNAGFGSFGSSAVDNNTDMFDGVGAELVNIGDGGIFGGQIGYNYLRGRHLYGIEGDFQWTSFDDSTEQDFGDHDAAGGWDWFATIRGRVGRVYGNTLLYATGGVAFVNADYCGGDDTSSVCSTDGLDDLAINTTEVGYVVGAGAEVMLSSRVSLKGEYLFVDAGDTTETYDSAASETVTFSSEAHMFRLGLNMKFQTPN